MISISHNANNSTRPRILPYLCTVRLYLIIPVDRLFELIASEINRLRLINWGQEVNGNKNRQTDSLPQNGKAIWFRTRLFTYSKTRSRFNP